jgi:outer membrane lipoprotein-sorting protein
MRPALAILVLSAAVAASGEQKAKPALTAEQVIDKSIEAVGGRAAMEKLSSTWAKGTMEFTTQQMKGTMELFAKSPNKQLVVMDLESVGEIKQGFDGEVAWGQSPSGEIAETTGAPLDDMKRNAVFNAALKWRDLYPKTELTGQETLGDRKVYVIRLTTATGKTSTRYYDAETFYLLRENGSRETPQGTMDIKADFADYREVNGIKAPFLIKQSMAMGEIVLKIAEMKNNVEIADAKFSKPASPK